MNKNHFNIGLMPTKVAIAALHVLFSPNNAIEIQCETHSYRWLPIDDSGHPTSG